MSMDLRYRWHRFAALGATAGAAALAALSVAPLPASAAPAEMAGPQAGAPGAALSGAGVPWAEVGPGWELVQYSTRSADPSHAKPAPDTLYLVSPAGARYPLYTWPASNASAYLLAWSGDKARALVAYPATGKAAQLDLATGKLTPLTMAGGATPIGYTRPTGQDILGWQQVGSSMRLARYSQVGQLLKVLVTEPSTTDITAVGSAFGGVLAVSSGNGLLLVRNAGGVIRSLPVGASGTSCQPVRWQDARTVLAWCTAKDAAPPRLWSVPVSGAKPTAVTPQRAASSQDLGDLDAWQLSSGLYLQAATGCGQGQIFRQAANGAVTRVDIPGATGYDNWIVTASGSRLLVKAETGCEGSDSLLWINPATHAEQWLLHPPAGEVGVEAVVAYYTRENAS